MAAATSDLDTVAPDEVFWDLVCGDDDWLRAEFDAIIAHGFPGRPGRDSEPVCPWPTPRSAAHGFGVADTLGARSDPPPEGVPRQRSPPRG